MSRFLKSILALALIALPQVALAEGGAPVGVVDIAFIIKEGKATKSVQTTLDQVSKKLEDQAEKENKRLMDARNDLEKQQKTLPPSELEKKAADLSKKYQTSRQSFMEKSMKVRQAIEDVNKEVRLSLKPIMEGVAKDHGFSVLVDKQMTVFATSEVDVTNEVLASFNEKVPNLSLKLPDLGQ
jgi:outer membrane protein